MTTQITTPPPAERAEQEAQQRAMYARKAEMDRMASTIETERLRQMAEAREAAERLRAEREKARVEQDRKFVEEMAAARKDREATVPEAEALIGVVATAYEVSAAAARSWLMVRFGQTHIGFDLAKEAA